MRLLHVAGQARDHEYHRDSGMVRAGIPVRKVELYMQADSVAINIEFFMYHYFSLS
jgi:hypothetical protein